MNKLLIFVLSAVLISTTLSCRKATDEVAPGTGGQTPTTPATAAVTPVGVPVGEIMTAIIGPAGGSIRSTDERIRVDIPAGALTADQIISVQPLDKNHCPGGTGSAFRLLPHGLTFAKPATISFRYNRQDLEGTALGLLRIAFQNEKGSWQSPPIRRIDTTACTLQIETTHFSDWTFFKSFLLDAGNRVVEPNSTTLLHVWRLVDEPGPSDPKAIQDITLPEYLDTKYIKTWSWVGGGSLKPAGSRAEYFSPPKIPAVNPATVTVSLNIPTLNIEGYPTTDLRLVEQIYTAPQGISVQVDGGEWITFPGGANLKNTQKGLLGNLGADYVSITWTGNEPNTYRWILGTEVAFNLAVGSMLYRHVYEENKKPKVSGGLLVIDKADLTGVRGTFTLTPAGWIQPGNPHNPIGRAAIRGVFWLPKPVL